METAAIVVAAGAGTRFGAEKQFVALRGAPVAHHAVAAARASCDMVVVVIPARHSWQGPDVDATAVGGETRADSVRAGLEHVPGSADIIVVHDAARPLAPATLFRDVIAAVEAGADGAVPAVPVFDTVKRVEGDRVVQTVDREGLVTTQTPQAFRASCLRDAHRSAADATDDAALVEAAGCDVRVVAGDPRNIKITTALDLELAASLFEGGDR